MPLSESDLSDIVTFVGLRREQWGRTHLSPTVQYDGVVAIEGRDDFMAQAGCRAPSVDLHIKAVFIKEKRGAIFFEGVDSVTELSHRIA